MRCSTCHEIAFLAEKDLGPVGSKPSNSAHLTKWIFNSILFDTEALGIEIGLMEPAGVNVDKLSIELARIGSPSDLEGTKSTIKNISQSGDVRRLDH